jgi:hypothetical protein
MSVAASLKPVAIAAAILAVAGVWAAVYATTSGSHVARASVSPPAVVTTTNPSPSPLVFIDANAGERAPGPDRLVFPNALFMPIAATDTGWFTFEEDATVRRQPDGAPTISISSPGPSLMPGMRGWTVRAMAWRGKRIEISAYLRTQDVGETTGMNVSVWGPQGQVLATDMNSRQVLATDMNGGPLRIAGTHDWTRMASVLDVPADAERIGFGIGLWGPGRVWIDSFAMQSVPDTVPTTSDTQWHLSTQYTSKYRLVSDSSQPRNGHATARLESPGDGGAATGSEWGKLTRHDRAIGGLAGKRIKIRAMMKSENVTGSAGLFAIAVQYDEQPRYRQTESKHYLPVKGTSGWMPYATTLAVPPEFDVLEYGVRFEGAGTVWIDDITVEALP